MSTSATPVTPASAALELLSEMMLEQWQERDPFRAGPFGYPAAARLLPAHDDAAVDRRRRALSGIAQDAARVDANALNAQERLTRTILIEQAGSAAELLALRTEEFTVNQPREFSSASVLRGLTKQRADGSVGGRALLERFRQLPEFLRTDAELLARGTAAGRAPVRRLLAAAVDELAAYGETPIVDDPLIALADPAWGGADAWRTAAARIVEQEIRPAVARFVATAREQLLGAARDDEHIGVSWLPDGDRVYAAFLREETTLRPDPDALHEEGLAEMASIRERLSTLGGRVLGVSEPGAVLSALRGNGIEPYASPEAALAAGTAQMQRIEAELPALFGQTLPPCGVHPMPAATAKHYGGGQYMPGTADGARPGVFYINVTGDRYPHEVPGMITGGAVPGSHAFWSYAFAAEVPAFRRVAFLPAFVKGWAAYGGQLAHEIGFFDEPLAELGYWAKQAVNAARQVVDTGVHHRGWSWREALAYLQDSTALSDRDAEVELTRIVCMPGEGPIFTFGSRWMTTIREESRAAMGDGFDIRTFHDRLLENGAVPLDAIRGVLTAADHV